MLKGSLRSWLRRQPQPAEVRIELEDGEERTIKLSADLRNRWKGAESAILNSHAVSVHCVDSDGAIIRSESLREDDEQGESVDAAERRQERKQAMSLQAVSGMLDRYGDRMNEAFERGAQAANVSQENLVQIVSVLTQHLGIAIANLHTVSMQFANHLQENSGEEKGSRSEELLGEVLGAAARRAMGGGDANGAAKGKGKPNG
jgi:hypothetical protein